MKTPIYKTVYLYLTHVCDSGCSFCYRRGLFSRNNPETLGPKFMSEDKAFRILEFVFSELELDPKFAIYFWGGEPLLNFAVIKAVVEKLPQFLYHTNTNGAPINQRMYDWFSRHKNLSLTWSLGNAYEKYGSLKAKVYAEPWALKLVKENPQHNVNFMVTRYDRLLEDFDFLVNNVTRNITIDLATRFEHKEEDLERFADEYFSLLQKYKDDKELYQAMNPAIHSNLYFKEFGLKSQVEDFHYCRSGLERLFIDTAGGIWQCDNMYICQHNKLGDIEKGIDYSKLDLAWEIDASREKYLGQHCETCELYRLCPRNKCLGLNLEWMGDMFKPEPSFCKMCKVLFKITKRYIELEKEAKLCS